MTLSEKPKPDKARLKRLQAAEYKQRDRTREINEDRVFKGLEPLPIESVNVEALLQLQKYCCENCKKPLDFESKWDAKAPPALYPIIAHKLSRGRGGGHTVGNVWIWCWTCNNIEAPEETESAAKIKRLAAQKVFLTPTEREEKKQKRKPKWAKRPMNQKYEPRVKDINA